IHTAVRQYLLEEHPGALILMNYMRCIHIFRPHFMEDQFPQFILTEGRYPGRAMPKPAESDQGIHFRPGNKRFETVRMTDISFRLIDQSHHRFTDSNHFHHMTPPAYPWVSEILPAARVISSITDCSLSSILGFEPA